MSDHMTMEEIATPTTGYVRESYAREKYPDREWLIELRRQGFDRWLAAHDLEVLADARVRPEFTEYMPNDGEYEYTSDSDCDGSNVRYFRRRPRYEGSYHPWQSTTAEAHAAAVHREVEGDR